MINKQNKSPEIHSIDWGKIMMANKSYKDAKLFPGGSREWDWTETGTHHQPGIQPADLDDLLEHNSEVVILSKGYNERLHICDETKELLNNRGITFHILQTLKAVEKYNALCKNHKVGALIHSTC